MSGTLAAAASSSAAQPYHQAGYRAKPAQKPATCCTWQVLPAALALQAASMTLMLMSTAAAGIETAAAAAAAAVAAAVAMLSRRPWQQRGWPATAAALLAGGWLRALASHCCKVVVPRCEHKQPHHQELCPLRLEAPGHAAQLPLAPPAVHRAGCPEAAARRQDRATWPLESGTPAAAPSVQTTLQRGDRGVGDGGWSAARARAIAVRRAQGVGGSSPNQCDGRAGWALAWLASVAHRLRRHHACIMAHTKSSECTSGRSRLAGHWSGSSSCGCRAGGRTASAGATCPSATGIPRASSSACAFHHLIHH